MATNTARATKLAESVNAAKRDAYAAKSGKFANGTTLISGTAAKASITRIEKHVNDINDYAGFAVYNAAVHNNFDPLKRLFAAFVGVRGDLIGEGKTLRKFITKMTTGIDVGTDGIVSRRMSGREGQKVETPVTFRVMIDNQRKAGDVDSGFIMTYMEFRKDLKANQSRSKNRESIAGTKAGELADGQPTGEENATAPTMDTKAGAKPLPFGSIVDRLKEIQTTVNTGEAYDGKNAATAMELIASIAKDLTARMEAEQETAKQMDAIKKLEDGGKLAGETAKAG